MRLGATPVSSLAITLSRSVLASSVGSVTPCSPCSQAWLTFLALAAVLNYLNAPFPFFQTKKFNTWEPLESTHKVFPASLFFLEPFSRCCTGQIWWKPTQNVSQSPPDHITKCSPTLFCFTAFSTMTLALSSTSLVAPGASDLSATPGIGDSISLSLDMDLLLCFPVGGKSSVCCAELWS